MIRSQISKNVIGILLVTGFIVLSIVFYSVSFENVPGADKFSSDEFYTILEYIDGNYVWIEYRDLSNKPYVTSNGYSSVVKELDNEGKMIYRWYYLEGKKTKLTQGQYGEFFQYDSEGEIIEITFLDENANPINGTNGYSTIRKYYSPDGSSVVDMYYDKSGNAVRLPMGQYGIRHSAEGVVYLNQNMDELRNFNTFMQKNKCFVVFSGVLMSFIIVIGSKTRYFHGIIFLYLAWIICFTLVRSSHSTGVSLNIFWSYRQLFINDSIRVQILHNIWLFVPLGAWIYVQYHKTRYLLGGILFSGLIEIAQLVFARGFCELDDVFSNSVGAYMGYVMAYIFSVVIQWWKNSINKVSTVAKKYD